MNGNRIDNALRTDRRMASAPATLLRLPQGPRSTAPRQPGRSKAMEGCAGAYTFCNSLLLLARPRLPKQSGAGDCRRTVGGRMRGTPTSKCWTRREHWTPCPPSTPHRPTSRPWLPPGRRTLAPQTHGSSDGDQWDHGVRAGGRCLVASALPVLTSFESLSMYRS